MTYKSMQVQFSKRNYTDKNITPNPRPWDDLIFDNKF